MFRIALPTLLFTLAACAGATPPTGPGGDTPGNPEAPGDKPRITGGGLPAEVVADPALADSCNAEPAQRYLGKAADEATVKAAQAATGAKTVRVIPHEGMVTMDYRGDRLNVQLDADGKIAAITCG